MGHSSFKPVGTIKEVEGKCIFVIHKHIYNEGGSIKKFIPEVIMNFPGYNNKDGVEMILNKIGWIRYISPAAMDYAGEPPTIMILNV